MDDTVWITTSISETSLPAAQALLASAGIRLDPPAPGTHRRYVGGIDVDLGELGAVAVVDVDCSGSAWLRALAGEAARVPGLPDTLRASGARRLLAGEPVTAGDVGGWRMIATSPPLWILEL